ncbi:MAG TPA: diaminopimelate epimerase [Polyangiaceae bacterium]|jgi:diaminopimelate epimerase
MRRRFGKYEGLGNDFVVIDAPSRAVTAGDAVRLCDRRRGIGADGVLVVSEEGDGVRMRVLNADGSVPEMCGNGIRCVALHVAIARGLQRGTLVIATDAGPRACEIERSGDRASVRVDMGEVRFVGERAIDVGAERVTVAVGDAGNPHAILFGAFDDARIDELGPRIATHAAFPAGTNVEFARVHDGAIDLVVWERGVGRTLACGTGACATAVVAREKRLVRAPRVRVSLPGGDLEIEPSGGSTFMTGPARLVFRGELDEGEPE